MLARRLGDGGSADVMGLLPGPETPHDEHDEVPAVVVRGHPRATGRKELFSLWAPFLAIPGPRPQDLPWPSLHKTAVIPTEKVSECSLLPGLIPRVISAQTTLFPSHTAREARGIRLVHSLSLLLQSKSQTSVWPVRPDKATCCHPPQH